MVYNEDTTPFFTIDKETKNPIGNVTTNMTKEERESVYTLQTESNKFSLYDKWSAGLSLLCLITRPEDQSVFKKKLEKSRKNKEMGKLVAEEIQRIKAER